MKYGFLDEAGDVGSAEGSSRYLVVAVALVNNPHRLRRVVTKIRKSLGKRLKDIPELKAWHTPKRFVAKLLGYVAESEVEIVAVILDKSTAKRPVDPEDWYRRVCAQAVRCCLERYPRLSLAIDKRYTNQRLRDRLVQAIIDNVDDLSPVLVIEHSESGKEKAVQAADAVAWSLFQKYERGNGTLYEVIKDKIIVEEVLRK
ncbi:MAG: DUF3800 domain-containing protein [Anaerolineae bacterium]